MAWSMLGNLSFRQRLKQAPVDTKIMKHIQQKLKIGRTKNRSLKGDRDADIRARQQHLRDTFHGKAVLLKSASLLEELPFEGQPEVCFAGRSNVGKSSLINSLLNTQTGNSARVSPKPGETTSIDFYRILRLKSHEANKQQQQQQQPQQQRRPQKTPRNRKHKKGRNDPQTVAAGGESGATGTPSSQDDLIVAPSKDCPIFVDLPGYGFAHAKAEEQARWTALAEHYFSRRDSLATVCLVVDARHGLKDSDREFLRSLQQHGTPFRVVLTKSDLVDQTTLAKMHWLVDQDVSDCIQAAPRGRKKPFSIDLVSSRTHAGILELRNDLWKVQPKP